MEKLIDLAAILRSKNAGPLYYTFDVMFDSEEIFRKVMEFGRTPLPYEIFPHYQTSHQKYSKEGLHFWNAVSPLNQLTFPWLYSLQTVCEHSAKSST